ncbi:MAG: radical SAM protein [Bacteroidaceae bacterium]|nr:radical SAM protein [Bacteroidaceae bacterium]
MSTVLYSSPIFGPVHSRRLGVSLGINLMPADGKICTFDCIYCECGRNSEHHPHHHRPSRAEVYQALRSTLQKMKADGPEPNVLTFAGNGEPTANPEFPGIVDDVLALRDEFFPEAKVSVLSNGTRVTDPAIFNALLKLDNNIQKLDTVDIDYIKLIDSPVGHYDLDAIIQALCDFKGHVIIQTMFLTGTFMGRDMDNTTDRYVLQWLETVKKIAPSQVMIYTVDRETPVSTLRKASREQLDRIASLLRENGIETSVSY